MEFWPEFIRILFVKTSVLVGLWYGINASGVSRRVPVAGGAELKVLGRDEASCSFDRDAGRHTSVPWPFQCHIYDLTGSILSKLAMLYPAVWH